MSWGPLSINHALQPTKSCDLQIVKKKKVLERPFGGLNVVTSGDAWQFDPIGSIGAVYDNYLKVQNKQSLYNIATMFWYHEPDSFNCFKELTVERRCKDPWLHVCN